MINNKLNKLAGTLFVLALGTTTLFAQGWRNSNRIIYPGNRNQCISQIHDLSEQQKKEMNKITGDHQTTMEELAMTLLSLKKAVWLPPMEPALMADLSEGPAPTVILLVH